MSETHELILEAKHVTKKYPASGGRTLVANRDISLNMYRGRTLGIVGKAAVERAPLCVWWPLWRNLTRGKSSIGERIWGN